MIEKIVLFRSHILTCMHVSHCALYLINFFSFPAILLCLLDNSCGYSYSFYRKNTIYDTTIHCSD